MKTRFIGDAWQYNFIFKLHSTGVVVDITNLILKFVIKTNIKDTVPVAEFTAVHTDAEHGLSEINVDTSITEDLAAGTYKAYFETTDGTGNKDTFCSGNFVLKDRGVQSYYDYQDETFIVTIGEETLEVTMGEGSVFNLSRIRWENIEGEPEDNEALDDALTAKWDVPENAEILLAIDSTDISGWDSAASAEHSHSNILVLDGIDSTDVTNWGTAYTNNHTHSNKATLDLTEQAFTTALKSGYDGAVTASHSHSNKATLDLISAAFTTTLETNYNSAYSHVSNTSNPHSVTASQVGLGNVLNLAQEPAIAVGTSLQYWRGDKTMQTLDTLAVTENTNLYFTTARARGAISGASPISYNSTSGEISLTQGSVTHNNLGGLTSGDPHTQYVYKDGRAGGQIIIGGTAANDTMTIQANSASSGNTAGNAAFYLKVGDSGGVTAITALNNSNIGIGRSPSYKLDVAGAGQFGTYNGALEQNGLYLANTGGSKTALGLWQQGYGAAQIGFKANDNKLYILNSSTDGTMASGLGITITTTGLIGVNNLSPEYRFDVAEGLFRIYNLVSSLKKGGAIYYDSVNTAFRIDGYAWGTGGGVLPILLNVNGGDIAVGTTTAAAKLHIVGGRSAAFWGVSGTGLRFDAATFTDTSSSGTVATVNAVRAFGIPTLAASSAVVYTTAASVYIAGAPAAGANVTITNVYSLYIAAGNSYFAGNSITAGSLGVGTITSPTESIHSSGALAVMGGSAGYATHSLTGVTDYYSKQLRLLSFGDGSDRGAFQVYLANQNNSNAIIPLFVDKSGHVGFAGSSLAGGTTYTINYDLSFHGGAARTWGIERRASADVAGLGITFYAGGCKAGSTTPNLAGGDIVWRTGIPSGNATSKIQWVIYGGGSSGTDDAPAVTGLQLEWNLLTLDTPIKLKAGIATAGFAPLYMQPGTVLSAPAAGALEFDGTNLYFTPSAARKTIAFTDSNITGNAATVTNGVYTNAANSFTLINPLTTIAESWIGPSSTAGIYFKGGYVGLGTTNPEYQFDVRGGIFRIANTVSSNIKGGAIYYDATNVALRISAYNWGAGGGALQLTLNYDGGNVAINQAVATSALDVAGDVEVGAANAHYFGDPTTDGTWKFVRSGNDLLAQRRESGSYVTKQTISA